MCGPGRPRPLRGVFAAALLVLLALPVGAAAPEATPVPRPAPKAADVAPMRAPLPAPRPGPDEPVAPEQPAAPAEAPAPPPLPGTPDRPEGPEVPKSASEPETPAPEETAEPEEAGPSPYAVLAAPLPPKRPGLSGSTLIGIFALTTGRTALMRFPSGEVRRLSVGDEIDGWRVDAIARDSLRFARGGNQRTFVLMGN